jgi:hypothetical protein
VVFLVGGEFLHIDFMAASGGGNKAKVVLPFLKTVVGFFGVAAGLALLLQSLNSGPLVPYAAPLREWGQRMRGTAVRGERGGGRGKGRGGGVGKGVKFRCRVQGENLDRESSAMYRRLGGIDPRGDLVGERAKEEKKERA